MPFWSHAIKRRFEMAMGAIRHVSVEDRNIAGLDLAYPRHQPEQRCKSASRGTDDLSAFRRLCSRTTSSLQRRRSLTRAESCVALGLGWMHLMADADA